MLLTVEEIQEVVEANPQLVAKPEGMSSIGQMLCDARWEALKQDMNGDGAFTIGDVWGWAGWILFLPGDGAVIALMKYAPGVAQFLELSPAFLGGWVSGALSTIVWMFTWGIVAANN